MVALMIFDRALCSAALTSLQSLKPRVVRSDALCAAIGSFRGPGYRRVAEPQQNALPEILGKRISA